MTTLTYTKKILKFVQELFVIICLLTLCGQIPFINSWIQELLSIMQENAVLRTVLICVLACLVTVFMLPLTPIIAGVVLLYPDLNLVSWSALWFCVEMSAAITVGRMVLYGLAKGYARILTRHNKLDPTLLQRWSDWLNKTNGKFLYFITGCFPGCPDAYLSVACGMMKYNFGYYLVSGFVSKIIKVFLYVALIKILNCATSTNIVGSWTSILIQFTCILVLDIFIRGLDLIIKRKVFNSYHIDHAKLNGYKYVKLHLAKSDYQIAFRLTDKKSPLEFQLRNADAEIVCNGGLFDTKTRMGLGQTIIDKQITNILPVTSDNGKAISSEECYPLILDTEGKLHADFANRSAAELLVDQNVKSCLCGWGCLINDFKACELYKKEIVHKYPLRRQRLVIAQDENNNYLLYAFHSAHYKEIEELLLNEKVKFAYCLDGGHSTQVYIKGYCLTPRYWFNKGRRVNNCIIFKST